jgi:DNA mismatch repair protein MutS
MSSKKATAEAPKKKRITPMMEQFNKIKEANPNTVLFYRMGDFYELFNEDAELASKILGITLTKRNHGAQDPTPLAGFPYHALDRYAHKMVKAGYRIAVCEQVEDPKLAKGLVKRDVIEVISAGTGMDDSFLDDDKSSYIVAIIPAGDLIGFAGCELSTGEFFGSLIELSSLEEEIARIDPSEILFSETERGGDVVELISKNFSDKPLTYFDGWKCENGEASKALLKQFSVNSLEGLGLEGKDVTATAAGALLTYLKEQKRSELSHIRSLRVDSRGSSAQLDPATIRNLELLKPLHTDESGGTLISILDTTVTSLGSRMMKRWVVRPLTDIGAINQRFDAVEWFGADLFLRSDFESLLKAVSDLERGISRVTMGRANGRDLVSIKNSLLQFPAIIELLQNGPSFLVKNLILSLAGFEEVTKIIGDTLVDEPPLSIKDGRLIREGINEELDIIRDAAINGKEWIAKLQKTEREKLGVESLKVGYNKVFGYFIEVSKANVAKVPESYIRKQTLVNAERYITPELKEMEATVLGAEEKLSTIENEIFVKLRNKVSLRCEEIQRAGEAVAILDVLSALGRISADNNYIRPTLTDSANMNIIDGRHPVVEQMSSDAFVPNDTSLIENERQLLIITGPNMAGKSTYLRQNALIALMAQMGSFVPAESAEIGVVDRFFTRIGASDRLARGQSTFLVEMIEVANILNNATDRSLVLLDEVGRGTSTFDGVSIAWAVAEYIHNKSGKRARTFFATHYHELTELETLLPRVANLHITVKEWNDSILFLRKIVEGGSSHSYGIQVAALAGVPEAVLARAREILGNLEGMEFTKDHTPTLAKSTNKFKNSSIESLEDEDRPKEVQLNFFDSGDLHPVVEKLREVDIYKMTPLEALNFLAELRDEI